MSEPPVIVDPWSPLAWAARLMRHHDVKRLCVVDPTADRLVGIVSRSDLLTAYLRSDATIRDQVEAVLREWSRQRAAGVEVGVADGVVRLTGAVNGDLDAGALPALVAAVDGVVRVDVELGAVGDGVREVSPRD